MNKQNISKIEKTIGYVFTDKNLLIQAFTHSSFANENSEADYERLEFLGDSILEALTTYYLYQNFDENEGILSKMRARVVSAPSLCKVIIDLGLDKYIRVGGSVGRSIPDNIIADVFESIVAGIYIDGGIDQAKEFVDTKLLKSTDNIRQIYIALADYKTMLQEYYQSEGKIVKYNAQEIKNGNTIMFEVSLLVDDKVVATATASSKKNAEQSCAKMIIERNGGIL